MRDSVELTHCHKTLADLYSPLSMSRVLVISCSGGASTSNSSLAPLCPAASSCCGHAWNRRLQGVEPLLICPLPECNVSSTRVVELAAFDSIQR